MKHKSATALACLSLCSVIAIQSRADEPATHSVKAGAFQVIETVSATLEAKIMVPVAADTENWSELVIEKIVNEGDSVKKGDPLVWFDTEKIDVKLAEAKQALALSELALQSSQLEVDQLNQTFNLDQQLAERKHRIRKEDFDYFVAVEKPNRERSTEFSLKNSQDSVEYSQEELNQLERMYKEDELTEESEEIVLKRARRAAENSQFYLEQAELRAAKTMNQDLPRELERMKDELERSRLELEKAKLLLPLDRQKKELELEKARFGLKKQQDDLSKLQADRERMTLTAPEDGVVYYGQCENGKWTSGSGAPVRNLSAGKSVPQDKTVITIVNLQQLQLRATLDEKQLANIRSDMNGIARPIAFPDRQLDVQVENVSYIPQAQNQFDCIMSLPAVDTPLMPGMKCDVTFVAYAKENALTVPKDSVFSDDQKTYYVYVHKDETSTRTEIEIGKTSEGKTEVLSGLKKGDTILLSKPE